MDLTVIEHEVGPILLYRIYTIPSYLNMTWPDHYFRMKPGVKMDIAQEQLTR